MVMEGAGGVSWCSGELFCGCDGNQQLPILTGRETGTPVQTSGDDPLSRQSLHGRRGTLDDRCGGHVTETA